MSWSPIPRQARVADVIAVASRMTGIGHDALLGHNRKKQIMRVRQAIYLVARRCGHSYPQIGTVMDRDHSTVIHGTRVAEIHIERDPAYAAFVEEIYAQAVKEAPFIKLVAAKKVPDKPKPAPKPRARPLPSDMDAGHLFHAGIAAGSQSLLAAITRARAA